MLERSPLKGISTSMIGISCWGMAGEERVVAEVVAGTVGNGEHEGLEPSRAALGVGGNDNIVAASLEARLKEHDPLEKSWPEPEVLVEK